MDKSKIGKEGGAFKVGDDGTIIRINQANNPRGKGWLWILLILIVAGISVIIVIYNHTSYNYTYQGYTEDAAIFADSTAVVISEIATEEVYSVKDFEVPQNTHSTITQGAYYKVVVSQAEIYDYYGTNDYDAYFDKKSNGVYYPNGTQLFIEYEFQSFGKITYNDENGLKVRGFIKMSDLKIDE
jgi:hypothetical protein